jgi:hypothetical protein
MATEVTASLMIGPVSPDSAHGKPAPTPAGKWFCPSHLMVLMEGARATWVVHSCTSLGRPTLASRIHPHSPEHLLAAAVLGYTVLTVPGALNRSNGLRNAIEPTPSNGGLRIGPIDRELATQVFATCAEFVDGVITVLPGSSITDDELRIAAGCGFQVAVAASTVGASPVAVSE